MSGRVLGAVVASALALAACGGDDDASGGDDERSVIDDAEATDVGADGAVYTGELADGSDLRIRLDVPSDDPAVAPFEEFRAATGADPPTWIIGEITPPEGIDGTGRFLTFVAAGADRLDDDPADHADGVTNSEFACAVIEDWFSGADVQDQGLNDAFMEVYDGPCGGQAHQVLAAAGATTTYVMVYDGPLPDFESIEPELGNELSPA